MRIRARRRRRRADHLTIFHRTEGGWLISEGAFSGPARVRRRASAPERRSTQPLGEYFTRPFFTTAAQEISGYYRPLVVLSFALDYSLHDGAASGLHLTNVVLHLASTLLFAVWLRQETADLRWPA